MDKQNNQELNKLKQASSSVWTITISVFITALVVGGGVYFWQNSNSKTKEQEVQKQDKIAQNQVTILPEKDKNIEEKETPTPTKSLDPNDKIKLPIVVFGRQGLLTDPEKIKLEEKLINPYTDYHNENEVNLVALYIVVPINIGEEYEILGIFGSKKQYGTEEFYFGKREQEFEYWKPECMGPCEYSETFKNKYPQITE